MENRISVLSERGSSVNFMAGRTRSVAYPAKGGEALLGSNRIVLTEHGFLPHRLDRRLFGIRTRVPHIEIRTGIADFGLFSSGLPAASANVLLASMSNPTALNGGGFRMAHLCATVAPVP